MRKLLAIASFLTLLACAGKVFSDSETFDSNRWPRSQAVIFDFEIREAGRYNLFVDFSHVYEGIPMASVPMRMSLSGPHSETFDFDLQIMKNGKHAGDCAGDYCDISALITTAELQPGAYKLALNQDFDHDFLPNVIRAGFSVKKDQ